MRGIENITPLLTPLPLVTATKRGLEMKAKGTCKIKNAVKNKFHDNDKLYFISFATTCGIDAFVREEYMQVLIDSWKHRQEKKGLEVYGCCIMFFKGTSLARPQNLYDQTFANRAH